MNVIAEMPMPPLYKGGEIIVCPVCGQDEELTLVIDSRDFSESASIMRCDDAHQWAEPRFPRRMGAELLATLAETRPETLDWSEVDGNG